MKRRYFPLLIGLLSVVSINASLGETLLVSSTNNAGPGTLRDAIEAASAGSTICFASSLSGQTITLGGTELLVDKDLTINAPSVLGGITIDADERSRVFSVAADATITMRNLNITGGAAPAEDDGGGIHNSGSLTLDRCKVYFNRAGTGLEGAVALAPSAGGRGSIGGHGGGIYSGGNLMVIACEIYDNNAGYGGVGGWGEASDPLNPSDGAGGNGGNGGNGGGIYSTGELSISASTLFHNAPGQGGPGGFGIPYSGVDGGRGRGTEIYSTGRSELSVSTIVQRVHYDGIRSEGEMVIDSCTILNSSGAGVSVSLTGEGSSLSLKNSFVGKVTGSNIVGIGINYVGSSSTAAGIGGDSVILTPETHGDPKLSNLDYRGGPTQTIVPLSGSPLIGMVSAPLAVDQRGLTRSDPASLGAVEFFDQAEIWNTDEDGDGLTWGYERAIGTDPIEPNSSSTGQLKTTVLPDGGVELSFGYNWNARSEFTWVLKSSDDLGEFTTIMRHPNAVAGVSVTTFIRPRGITVRDARPNTGQRFYILEAELKDE